MTNSPTQMLEEEHRFIAKAVSATAVIADKLETGEALQEFGRVEEAVGRDVHERLEQLSEQLALITQMKER